MMFTIKTFAAHDGERFSQIYQKDSLCFPLFYPTAYIARAVRSSATHETQKVYLAAIKKICEWEKLSNIDLAENFHKKIFLSAAQIDNLANHLHASKLKTKGNVISSSKYNTYISCAADYLRWLSQTVITDSNTIEIREMLIDQHNQLTKKKKRKTGSKSANEQYTANIKLEESTRNQLLDLFDAPLTKLARAQDSGQRLRNILMLRILYETGMRRGELLSLKLKNIIESGGSDSAYLEIERNHHDEFDHRLNQPVAKTLGRKVPISPHLEEQIQDYISNWRAEVPRAGFSDEDFIFIVHRRGKNQGTALPITTFDNGLSELKKLFISFNTLHPHLLRHDWNYRFSKIADIEGLSFQEERTIREQLMGWAPGSDMSRIYNQRHIQEQSHQFGLKIAQDTERNYR